ncbi:hypothetical protein [Amycolatopsis palatopharyngis]|uniref:hypothetical protein n=1 Tax=Amycolatopsis palatopharyngis TaxID=187982 RepID=UPI0013BE9B4E|nr:hypothetical protein [Amycolatopsis palatopharyngis]
MTGRPGRLPEAPDRPPVDEYELVRQADAAIRRLRDRLTEVTSSRPRKLRRR